MPAWPRRLLVATMTWRHPARGAGSGVAMLLIAGLLSRWLSPLGAIEGNNRAAAAGIALVALAAAGYVGWRLARYVRLRRHRDHEPLLEPGACAEVTRYLGLDALAAVLALAPVLGRGGYPLWRLGYGEPLAWFVAGATAMAGLLAAIWPDWSAADGHRLLPRVHAPKDDG